MLRKILDSDRILIGILVAVVLVGLAARNRDALADTATKLVKTATSKLRVTEDGSNVGRAMSDTARGNDQIKFRCNPHRTCHPRHSFCLRPARQYKP